MSRALGWAWHGMTQMGYVFDILQNKKRITRMAEERS